MNEMLYVTVRKCDGCMTWGCNYFITYTNYSGLRLIEVCSDEPNLVIKNGFLKSQNLPSLLENQNHT